MPAPTTRLAALALVAGLALAGCTDAKGPEDIIEATPEPTVEPSPARAELLEPAGPATVLAPDEPAALALATSTTFFAAAPVVVLADSEDPRAVLRGASAGVALAAPVLLTGQDSSFGAQIDAELARLGTDAVLAFGDVERAGMQDVSLVAAPEDDTDLGELLGLTPGEPVVVSSGDEIAGLMELTRGDFTPLHLDGGDQTDGDETASGDGSGETATGTETVTSDETPATTDAATEPGDAASATSLPETEPADPLTGVLTLSSGSITDTAALATAAAAGAELAVAPQGDPRATSASVSAVAQAGAAVVVGLGSAFDDAQTLGWRAATAATGIELPGGGQLLFPGKRYVALYGTPSTSALGVLGEQDVPATIERAAELASAYDDLSDDEVVPALEIIATVASAGAGSDGNYSNELPVEGLRPLIEAAQEAGQYVVLDLQPGRSSFLEQAQHYEELLAYPHVGLALDPEWNLGPDERHMVRIGSTTSEEVNDVVDWLADLTRERALPQKLLVLHQFQVRMIQTVADVDLSRSEVAVLVHADGQGGQPAKQGTWATLHANAPNIQWWGWKNFYDEDLPMLTPEQTAQVEPFPNFISYQ